MSRLKKGFTLIEVALFLVITGALFAAVTVGVQNSIYQQRFNDAVQNFAEFLRSVYAETMNVQSIGTGRTEKAIYGRLITFGESVDASASGEAGGNVINQNDTKNVIYVYDVIGDVAGDIGTGDVLGTLVQLNADVIRVEDNMVKAVGIIDNYTPKWSSQIEPACNEETKKCSYDPFKGAILIVRHPVSGTVFTFVMEGETVEINDYIGSARLNYQAIQQKLDEAETDEQRQAAQIELDYYLNNNQTENRLKDALNATGEGGGKKFKMATLDLCVNPEGDMEYSNRRDVRIVAGARNASGVELLSDDQSRCRIQE
ncbi:hypothetical protein IKD98_01465 [Candidatus Saccharibacteria bacterium]|nr:hypothetical protein [Candidatus Saccharibacteria bacterium]